MLSAIGRSVTILLFAASGCRGAPATLPTTCDFLMAPEKYEDRTVELHGRVIQAADETYRVETYCSPSDRPYMMAKLISVPLIWRNGERWPEGILRVPRDQLPAAAPLPAGGRLTGQLKRNGRQWFILADEFGPVRYDL